MKTLICDISQWQNDPKTVYKPDLSKMSGAGIHGVIMRASQGLKRDRDFEDYWGQCVTHDIPRMVYGFLEYWQGSAAQQGAFLADWFGGLKVRAFLDFEQATSAYPALPNRATSLDLIKAWMDAVEERTGMEAGIYLNLSTVQMLKPLPAWLAVKPFWLAWPPYVPSGMSAVDYTQNMTPPKTPFTNTTIWQFSWVGPGLQAGMESKGLDLDWFDGDIDALRTFCGLGTAEPVNLTDAEKLARLWKAHPELWK